MITRAFFNKGSPTLHVQRKSGARHQNRKHAKSQAVPGIMFSKQLQITEWGGPPNPDPEAHGSAASTSNFLDGA